MTVATGEPRITEVGTRVRWSVSVTGTVAPGVNTLWFDLPSQWAALLSDRSDAALVALLLPAMRTGRDLHVGGVVTDELLRWVNEHLQGLICAALFNYRKIRVTSDRTAAPGPRGPGVAMGFSAGVDSLAAL